MSNFEEYQELSNVGFQGGVPTKNDVPPEKEDFHSIYVAGKTRENHVGVTEKTGLLQIRGYQYNLTKVNMVITHTKDILNKAGKNEKGKEISECFSFKEGSAPWFGNTTLPNGEKRQCPNTSAERLLNDFCKTCKAQIIVAGIICNENGTPVLTEERKPVFGFIRGKSSKYMKVSEYLNEMFKLDLDPIFTPVTDQSKQFEKAVVNNKRFVTSIVVGKTSTSYGNEVNVFDLSKGVEIPKEAVLKILKLSKDTVKKFNEKFDWSSRKASSNNTYTSDPRSAEGILSMDDDSSKEEKKDSAPQAKTFSFDDISL